jgi:antitoxin component of MazEF toxin-antitoxin module
MKVRGRRPKYKLADLMAEIPPGTKFEEIYWGPPVGKEIL